MSLILTSPIPLIDYILWCLTCLILFYLCYRYQYARIHGSGRSYLDISNTVPIIHSHTGHRRRSISQQHAQAIAIATATATATAAQLNMPIPTVMPPDKHKRQQSYTVVPVEAGSEIGIERGDQQPRDEHEHGQKACETHHHHHHIHLHHVMQVKPSDDDETQKSHPPYPSDALVLPPSPVIHQVRLNVVNISPHPTVPTHVERRLFLHHSSSLIITPSPSPSPPPAPSLRLSHSVNYCILIVALTCPFRLVCWLEAFYGFDRTAIILHWIWSATASLRMGLLGITAMRIAYTALDVTFVAVTYSTTPRYIKYPYIIIGISTQISTVISTILEMTWNKSWPGGVSAVMIGVLCATVMIILNISVFTFSKRLNDTELNMDEKSRLRLTLQVSRLRRSSVYASCAMFAGICTATYMSYLHLSDIEMEFMQHEYFIPITDWAQVIVCAWMRWYFKAQ